MDENGSFSSMIYLSCLNVISIAMWVTQRILYLLLTFSEVSFERIRVRWLSMKKHHCTRVERVSNLEFHCWLVVSSHPRSVWKVKNSQKLTPPIHKAPQNSVLKTLMMCPIVWNARFQHPNPFPIPSPGLVTVPFWEYWTSPYSNHLVDHIPNPKPGEKSRKSGHLL